MKVRISILMILILSIIVSCSSPTDSGHSDGPVTLEIYSRSCTSGMIDQISVEENQDITILGDYSEYTILAKREGYFTELYQCNRGGTITVQLKAVDESEYSGTLIKTSDGIPVSLYSDRTVFVLQNEDTLTSFYVDSDGHFSTEKITTGIYRLSLFAPPMQITVPVAIDSDYQDIYVEDHAVVKKPNIYLYPEEDSHIALSLEFPNGGSVTESIPQYSGGWDVDVTTEGKIGGQYDYLFYECDVPDYCQYAYGWVVPKDGLKDFFESNMQSYGFNEKEIGDFTEYWIPRLTTYENYIIYPQLKEEISNMVIIQSSKAIDREGRLFYSIKGTNYNGIQLTAPDIVPFNRDGFTLMEWGVILK